jgi:hypothetical protein
VALAVVASLVFGAGATPADASRLVAVAETSQDDDGSRDAIEASLEGTPEDVPRLARLLKTGSPDQRAAAMRALGYMGGDRAIAALAAYAGDTGDRAATALLYFAMGARGSAADRRALIDALDERSGVATFAAALALGVLRADEARPRLAALAHAEAPGYARDAAATALSWLERGTWQAEVPEPSSDDALVVAAIMRHGIPGVSTDTVYADATHGGLWIHEHGRWRVRQATTGDAALVEAVGAGSTLDFGISRSRDGARALALVAVSHGPDAAAGWDYVLAKQAGGWRVRGVMLAWVS